MQQVDLLQLHLARGAAPGKGLTGKGLTGKGCTWQGAAAGEGTAAGEGLPKEEKEACVTLACCNNHTRTSCTVCTGDDVCNTCDARAELVQAGLLACLAGSLASPPKKCPRKKSSRWHKTQTLPSLKHNFCTVKKLVQYTCLHLPFHSCSLVKRSITKHSVKRQKTEILKSESVLKM